MNEQVLLERIEQIATLTLNRPARHNSLTPTFLEYILSALAAIREQTEVRGVILQANGRSFSTGGDVRSFYEHLESIENYAQSILGLLNQVILELINLPIPVIAAVHGIVTGGSLGFVLAADIVLVTPQASFTPYYNVVGFSPDGGWTAILPEIIGIRRTAETLMQNHTITAEQAIAWGLANQIVSPETLFENAVKTAREIAGMHSGSLLRTKTLLSQRWEDIESRLEAEKTQFVHQISTEEARRGMEAFLNK